MLLSIRGYAKHRGVVESAVRKAIETGRIKTVNGKIDPDFADGQWDKNTHPAQSKQSFDNTGSSSSYQSMRAKRETYEVLLKKMEYEEKAGKLIPIEQVETEAFNAARIARDKLMNIPDRVAPTIIGKTDIHEIKEILRVEIFETLQNLTDFLNGTKS